MSPTASTGRGVGRQDGGLVDTIAAVGTAPGVAALALVRLSGPDARRVLGALTPERDGPFPGRTPTLSRIRHPETGELLDRGLVTVFPAPASYTGEEMVEISTHGGWLVPSLVLDACVAAGARQAEAGEFTRRAYLNGKVDLVQAEAVADLVESRSRALHGAALGQLERGLSARLAALREDLVGLEALLVHHIDFPEEDEPPVPLERIVEEGRSVVRALRELLRTAPEGELLREGALTVLAGPPNSGKSSLFNALVGEERAIVTEIPGTTRDALEAVVSLGGFPFRLVDTAGLREAEEAVERLGIEVAERYLGDADLVLFCHDAPGSLEAPARAFVETWSEGRPVVLLRTKADLREDADAEDAGGGGGASDGAGPVAALTVSARTGRGLDELRAVLPRLVYGGLVEAGVRAPVLTRARQRRGVGKALQEVEAFVGAVEDGVPAEMAATHLRPAETALEELLGVIAPDEVLDRLFR